MKAEVERRQNHMRMRRKPVQITQVGREGKVTGEKKNLRSGGANRKFVSFNFRVHSEITQV